MKIMNKILLSIEAEKALLKDIIEKPRNYLTQIDFLISALKSQRNFSALEIKSLGIQKYSLNTHKDYINIYFQESFSVIDNLRKKAYKTLKNIKINKENIRRRIPRSVLDRNLTTKTIEHNYLLMSIILNLKSKLEFYANISNDIKIKKDYEIFINEIESMLSLANGSQNI